MMEQRRSEALRRDNRIHRALSHHQRLAPEETSKQGVQCWLGWHGKTGRGKVSQWRFRNGDAWQDFRRQAWRGA